VTALDLAFRPTGPVTVGQGDERDAILIRNQLGRLLLRVRIRGSRVHDVAFSPDGTTVAIAANRTVYLRTAAARATDSKSATLTGLTGWPHEVVFPPDGTRLAIAHNARPTSTFYPPPTTADHADQLSVWHLDGPGRRTGLLGRTKELSPVATIRGIHLVNGLAFSPDGVRLAVAGDDGSVTIWRIERGSEPYAEVVMHGHGGPVLAVAFSPEGSRLAAAAGDETVIIYELESAVAFDAETGSSMTARTVMELVHLPDGGYATLLPGGKYKLEGDPGDRLWWAMKLCRFGAGELDPYVPEIEQLAAEATLP
jgi:WD40 repeat protein